MLDGMDARAAFKLGFLTKCAEDGVTPEELQLRIKTAVGLGETALNLAYKVPTALMIGALPVGFGAGYALGDFTAPPAETAEDIKQKELLAAYRRAAARAENITKRMQFRNTQQPRMPRLPSSVLE